MRAGLASLPLDRFRLAVEACDRFEAAWRSGDRSPIDGFLDGFAGADREVVRTELLALAGEFTVDQRSGHPAVSSGATPGVPPRRIGRFEILGVLGRGGMGVVYRARQPEVGRVVALKVIRPGLAEDFDDSPFEAIVSRFLAEVRAVGGIAHENVVEVYEAGRWEGQYYYAMRLIEGRTLAEVIREGPIAGREAASILEPVARAVDFAHGKGVIHRDLKPSNILVDQAGRPFVADFGLAKILDGDESHTRTGELLGSPPYMAPEQVGDPAGVGPACDVYALGATLYEAIAGRPPFRAAGVAETLRQVVDEPPPRPRDLNRAISRDLETICLKCLEKEPARRYASAGELAEDLRRHLEGRPIRARPVAAAERAARWARRDPKSAALALAGLVVAGGLLGIWSWSVDRDRKGATSLLRAERRRAEEQSASAREARRRVYAAEVRLACDAWDDSRAELAGRLLEGQRPGAGEEDLRGFEWWHLRRLCDRDLALRGHRGAIRDLAFSPDGATLATAGLDGTIRLWDAGPWTCRAVLRGHGRTVRQLAFAADGRWLYSGGDDGTIRRWDVRDGREAARFGGDYGSIVSLAISPDGRTLAFHPTSDRQVDPLLDKVWLADSTTGEVIGRCEGHSAVVWALAFSPDGRTLASGSADRLVRLWDVQTRRMIDELPKLESDVEGLEFAPNGRSLAGQTIDGSLHIWTLSSDRTGVTPSVPGRRATCLAYSPDGDRLACGGADGESWLVDVETLRGTVKAPGHAGRVNAVAISQGSGVLATGGEDGVVRLRDGRDGRPLPAPRAGAPGREVAAIGEPGAILMGLALAPDGASLVVSGERELVEAREPGTGTVRFRMPQGRGYVNAVAFSPDGRALYTSGQERPIRSWDALTGDPLVPLEQPGPVRIWWDLAVSPDGRTVVAGGGYRGLPGEIGFWEATSGRLLGMIAGHRDYVRAVAVSPDGRVVATGGGDQVVRLFELSSRRPVADLSGHDGAIFALAYSPDGRTLASAAEDQTIRLWDPASGRELARLRGHESPVRSLAFDPSGRRLASGAGDAIILWDFLSRREVARLTGHAQRVNRLVFSNDGQALYSVSSDRTLRTWRAGPGRSTQSGGPKEPGPGTETDLEVPSP